MRRFDMPRLRPTWTTFVALLFAGGCSGDGCSCVTATPGGFPAADRTDNAIQLRITQTAVAAIEADPAALVSGLIGDGSGTAQFEIPPACDPADDPKLCCDGSGNPVEPCGPIDIDLNEQIGDLPRLELVPVQGSSHIDVTIRARISTASPLPIDTQGVQCDISIDTTNGVFDDIEIIVPIDLTIDPEANTTRITAASATINQFESDDVTISGGIACLLAELVLKDFVIDELIGTVEDTIRDGLNDAFCKSCDSGDVADCGEFADACDSNTCMKGGECLQEIGIAGRMAAEYLLGGFSSGQLGSMDIYEVAGEYATTDDGGISIGLLGGMLPAGELRDRCGPMSTRPADVTIPESSFFNSNTRPDTNAVFDVGIGIHQHNLDLFSWAAYESGLLCLNVGGSSIDLLNSDTLSVVMPSIIELVHGENVQMFLGLRPQNPPDIVLGLGTFLDMDNSEIDEPLLDITFRELDIDFFAMIDDQFIRVMTLTADVNLPINLDVDPNGELIPVIGALDDSFTNVSVTNSEALVEPPDELADKFPSLITLALPLLGDSLGGFALPDLGGLKLTIPEGGITAVDNKKFLAIFADLDLATPMARVVTEAQLGEVWVPDTEVFFAPRFDRQQRPSFELLLGGTLEDDSSASLEYSYRIDGSLWSPYTTADRLTVSRESLWLQGVHRVEVRARVVGKPLTADLTPVVLEPIVDTIGPRVFLSRPTPDAVWVLASDHVNKGNLRVDMRTNGGEWQYVGIAPAPISLTDYTAEEIEIRVRDTTGNETITNAAGPSVVVSFHGRGQGGGCGCSASDNAGTAGGAVALLLLSLLGFGRRWRRRRWAALVFARGTMLANAARVISVCLLLGAASMIQACSCGSDVVCFGGECLEGELERGPTGRWNSVALTGERVVISAYDDGLGDLVVIDFDGETLTYQAVDGVPDVLPSYQPDTYRDGIVDPGANVGAWTSIALYQNLARVAYQDVDNQQLKYATERDNGEWQLHVVDEDVGEAGSNGLYAALSLAGDGTPAIAYMAIGIDDPSGRGKLAQLRYAQATIDAPASASDWTVTIIDETPISCAGLCGDSQVCVSDAPDTDPGRCEVAANSCGDTCGGDEACVASACVAELKDPVAYDIPQGVGLFVEHIRLPDGTPIVVYYDRVLGDLILQSFNGAWTRTAIDAVAGTDTGMWASAAVDAAGAVHIAYQDAIGDRLLYTTWQGGTVGGIEIVDDGLRQGDVKTHNVGASATIFIDGSEIAIVYQDGATNDMLITRRTGAQWTMGDLLVGPHLYGFHVDAAGNGNRSIVTSYFYDRSIFPSGELSVETIR